MAKIYTVTLNPAVDVILFLDQYKPAVTNRLTDSVVGLGGKGTHVSLNLAQMGVPSVATGIAHGENGRKILNMLNEDGVTVSYQHYPEKESRTNYLMIEGDGTSTILASKGVPLSEADIESFIRYLDSLIEDGDYLIFSGDASNCPDPYVNNTIIQALAHKKLRVFMDASGETLKKSILQKPFLIKPNEDELSYVTGKELRTIEDIKAAAESIKEQGIPIVAVSLGGDGSLVITQSGTYRVIPPKVNVCNTIGCGDCYLSGLIYGIYKGLEIEETLRTATAISAACAESALSVGFDQERAKELMEQVKISMM